jgi:hypothetical protein
MSQGITLLLLAGGGLVSPGGQDQGTAHRRDTQVSSSSSGSRPGWTS